MTDAVGQPEVRGQHGVVDVREQAVQPWLPAAAVEEHRDAARGGVGGEHPRGPEVVTVDEQRRRLRVHAEGPGAGAQVRHPDAR